MPCSLQPFERGSVTALGHSCKTAPRLKDAGHILSEHLFILIGTTTLLELPVYHVIHKKPANLIPLTQQKFHEKLPAFMTELDLKPKV
jgi:hypothetical protein